MNDLLKRARNGDNVAFIALFEYHKQALWKSAMAVLGDRTDAADALQETVFKAWRAIPSFEGRSSVGTWLTRILLRTCYDMLRVRKQELPFSSMQLTPDVEGDEGFERILSQSIIAQEKVIDRVEVIDIRRTIDELSPNDRLLLTLFYLLDYPVKEIAAILSITEGAARTRLSRARDRFRQVYKSKQDVEVEVAR